MFVKKHFIYLGCVYLKKLTLFLYETFGTLILCEDEDIGRLSNLHYCTFNKMTGNTWDSPLDSISISISTSTPTNTVTVKDKT